MDREILQLAYAAFDELRPRYKKFINVGVDNWRGFRFIFDTEDVLACRNNCSSCELFQLTKDKKEGIFSSGLYAASRRDQELFGPNNFLNCKTFPQYQRCYSNWLVEEAKTEDEIDEELNLIRDFRIIYSKKGNDQQTLSDMERAFKQAIIKDAIERVQGCKRNVIIRLATAKELT